MLSLVEIGLVVLEMIFSNLLMYFRYFVIFSPWKRAGPFIWIKLNSPKDDLCQVWLKLAHWFCRRRFLKFVINFRNLVIISLGKRAGPFIWSNLNPFHPRMLCAKEVEMGPVILEKKMKMWKVYDNDDNNDDGQRTNFDQKSSFEPSAQVSLKRSWKDWWIRMTTSTVSLCVTSATFYEHWTK